MEQLKYIVDIDIEKPNLSVFIVFLCASSYYFSNSVLRYTSALFVKLLYFTITLLFYFVHYGTEEQDI